MTTATAPDTAAIHRIEITHRPGEPDPAGPDLIHHARAICGKVEALRSSRVFLISAPLTPGQLDQLAGELLADPITQSPVLGASPVPEGGAVIEVHYKPGVMDPVAQSTQDALRDMFAELADRTVEVRTGWRYDLMHASPKPDQLRRFAVTHLANPVIQDIRFAPLTPEEFAHGQPYELHLTTVAMRDLDDEALKKMSREAHLFLSLEEMRAIRDFYRDADREPTDIELETLAQTWSEHCVHKTLKSTVHYRPADAAETEALRDKPGHRAEDDGSVIIDNLLKQTVAAATRQLMEDGELGEWCVSVFEDNSGIVKFDDQLGVCIKVETHNHPSAIEPYGGAATGIGGCIRDILGTGLAARPIANTDTFCVAAPDTDDLPTGVIHPRRILERVVAGVRDYGNRMGIPTVDGGVYFHPGYLANPLVFAGCVGTIPLDCAFGDAKPGDHIIALGGATGRDGIHGATFSSAELTDTHADEFSHAVQIGNAITQKKMLDVILEARDAEGGPLFSAITDCGAGGFSSAVGEMGEKVGANVQLDRAPLKYQGLTYTEIWISEAQERMVLSVPPAHVDTLRAMCDAEEVPFCDLGEFGVTDEQGDPALVLNYDGTEVGRLSMTFLHDGIPMPTREAVWSGVEGPRSKGERPEIGSDVGDLLLRLLAHPNIASKHWVVRQYDHEVQGASAVKPLVGPMQDGPGDAAVVRPRLDSRRGVAIANGLCPALADADLAADADPYQMVLGALDEAIRNAVCVGADPSRIAILDNFCWPSCDTPEMMGALVRAAEACLDGALAYRTPFVSGKDSLNNQFTTEAGELIAIPPTMLITAVGIVNDVTRCRTMDAKQAGHRLIVVGETTANLGGSHLAMLESAAASSSIPRVDCDRGAATARAVARLIESGTIVAAHDCSDGGLLVAAAEMAFAGRVGLDLDLSGLPCNDAVSTVARCFAESPSRYLLEVPEDQIDAVRQACDEAGVPCGVIGTFADHERLIVDDAGLDVELDVLRQTWLEPLNW